MKVILHSILLCFFCLFIVPSFLVLNFHSRANRIGRLWIFEIVPLLDYRLYSQESHKQYTGEFFESNKTLRTLLSFKSFMRVFVTSLGELKEIVL